MKIEEAQRIAAEVYWTEPTARRALALLDASGLSTREFSARTGVSRYRLQYWRSRVQSGEARRPAVRKSASRDDRRQGWFRRCGWELG